MEVFMALDYTIIGERIKLARTKKKLTQENLAEKLDVSVPYLSRVECGDTFINLKRLNQICEILRCYRRRNFKWSFYYFSKLSF